MLAAKWLEGVSRILRSETGDLRELARIGGADPTTLYIGTSLDGVDIRGQDLRGMALPNLDVRKVRRDSKTLLDPGVVDQAPPPQETPSPPVEAAERPPLIYLGNPQLDRGFFSRGATLGARVVHHADSLAVASPDGGPVFVVFRPEDPGPALMIAKSLRANGIHFVSIALERKRPSFGPEDRTAMSKLLAPLISVLPGSRISIGDGGTLEARDLIGVISREWHLTESLLQVQSNWFFMRAVGVGASPNIDAAAQLFDRMTAARVTPGPVSILHYAANGREDRLWNISHRLLEAEDWLQLEWKSRGQKPPFDLAVLGSMEPTSLPAPDYFSTVINCMEDIGWRFPLDEMRRQAIHLKSDGREITISPEQHLRPPPQPDQYQKKLKKFSFDWIDDIVLSEPVGFEFILHALIEQGEFLVSARDLLGLSRERGGVWMLVASQMRKFSRSPSSLAKNQYLELLIRSAFLRKSVHLRDERLWLDALDRDSFAEDWRMTVTRAEFGAKNTTCRIKLAERGERNWPMLLEAGLWIDERGVFLHDLGTVPSPPEPRLPLVA